MKEQAGIGPKRVARLNGIPAPQQPEARVFPFPGEPPQEEPPAQCVFMYRAGERAVVNHNSVEIMAGLGWSEA